MAYLILGGTVLSLLGLAGLIGCILQAFRIRRRGDDGETHTRLQRLVAWNMGALALSLFGLVVIVTGIVLG